MFFDVRTSLGQHLLTLFLIFHRIYYMKNTCHAILSASTFIWKLTKLSWFN